MTAGANPTYANPSGQLPIDPSITSEIVELCRLRLSWFLLFPKALEAQFERDTGRNRCRQLIWRGVLAVVVLNLFALVDLTTVPDVLQLSLQLRLGILTPLAGAGVLVLLHNPRVGLREGMTAVMTTLGAAAIMILTVQTQSPLRAHYAYGIILVMMFATAVQVVRFWYAAATCLGVIVIYFLFASQLDAATSDQMALVPGLLVGAATLCLTSSYSLERESRLSYLNGLLERLHARRMEDLSDHDALTGLGNRRGFDNHFSTLRPVGTGTRRISAILVDIDYFKAFNDNYGHLNGDECLKKVATILSSQYHSERGGVYRF